MKIAPSCFVDRADLEQSIWQGNAGDKPPLTKVCCIEHTDWVLNFPMFVKAQRKAEGRAKQEAQRAAKVC